MNDGDRVVLARLGGNVRDLRKHLKISQEDLAHQSGLDRTYVGGIERGERNVTILSALKLCGPLECSLSQLVKGIG